MNGKSTLTSRRAVLTSGAVLAGASSAPRPAAAAEAGFEATEATRIMERYFGFGDKASGGAGDNACGAWLEAELSKAGYACQRQMFEAPAYEGAAPSLTAGAARAELIPQAIVVPGRVEGRLRIAGGGVAPPGGVALVVLPHGRWSTAVGEVERRVRAAISEGAAGVVVVTTGPSGEALALNAPVDAPMFDRPVAILAPKDAEPFVQAARGGGTGVLDVPGRAIRRPAYNLTAVLKRGGARTLVLSTPRSGWFGCAGERGPGVAVWLMLARWAARTSLPVDVALVATSGHEYENGGGEQFIHGLAPKPDATALWVHIGANVAARDWHERGAQLTPLPSADTQRFLLASAALTPTAKAAFAGLGGLERVYEAQVKLAAGELGNILRAGYEPAMGIFGTHRYHHARGDDLRCVSGELVPPVAQAFRTVIAGALGVS